MGKEYRTSGPYGQLNRKTICPVKISARRGGSFSPMDISGRRR
jgi:hypothetical protein